MRKNQRCNNETIRKVQKMTAHYGCKCTPLSTVAHSATNTHSAIFRLEGLQTFQRRVHHIHCHEARNTCRGIASARTGWNMSVKTGALPCNGQKLQRGIRRNASRKCLRNNTNFWKKHRQIENDDPKQKSRFPTIQQNAYPKKTTYGYDNRYPRLTSESGPPSMLRVSS